MRKQTRARIIREKTATLSSLIDACDTIKSVVDRPTEDHDTVTDILTDLWVRLEKRICEHLPSTIEEADIQRVFLNNTVKEFGLTSREVDHNEGMVFLTSFNRMVQFYRQHYYKHCVSIEEINKNI